MKNTTRILALIFALAMLTLALCSCGTENPLVGAWYLTDSDFLIMNADNTCKIGNGEEIEDGVWTQVNERLYLTIEDETVIFEIIELTDNSLTIRSKDGSKLTFRKK